MCNLPKIVVGLKQVGSLLHRIDILVASCFASALDGDGACGGESEQGVLVNIARITRSSTQPPSALNTPQSRVSFVAQNSSFWTLTMMTSAMFVASKAMSMVVMFRRVFAGLQIVIRGIGHRSIKSNVSTANKPTPMERTCLKPISPLIRGKGKIESVKWRRRY